MGIIYKEKLQTIKDNVPKVYESGRKVGHSEGYAEGYADSGAEEAYDKGFTDGEQAGQKAEYDKFWDTFQNNGNSQNYNYAFSQDMFTDENYNPKYPIKCSNGITTSRYMFFASSITDTKVEIIVSSNNMDYCFHNSKAVTIRKITVKETTGYTSAFYNCSALKNITFGGTIGQDISFANSRYLTTASVDSIIAALKDLIGATAKKITFHSTVAGKLTDEQMSTILGKNWLIG
jgi:hypothetical protein